MSRGLLDEYLQLHTLYEGKTFDLQRASRVLKKPPRVLRLDMHRLNRNLALERVRRGMYATVDPDKWMGITMAVRRFPDLEGFFREVLPKMPHIDSIMLYGSRVRGDHREDSDYDVLIVTDGRISFTEEEEEALRRQGYQVNVGHETGLRDEIRERPVSIVPMLKEAWPIFNKKVKRSLLRSFRKENLLKDLKAISAEVIRMGYVEAPDEDTRRSVIFLSFVRGRHLFLMEGLLEGEAFFTSEWLRKMGQVWGIGEGQVEDLHRVYKEVERGLEPPVGHITDEELKRMTEGNISYLNDIIARMEGP